MKTYEEVQTMLEEVFGPEEALDQEAADAFAKTVAEAAVEEYGAGIYVRAVLNTTEGREGINVKWRRPSCRQKWDYFLPCEVVQPKRKAEAGAEKPKKAKATGNTQTAEEVAQELFDARLLLLEGLLPALTDDDYTNEGKPDVKALNALLDGDADFDAKERDNLWAHRSQG